MTRCTWANSHSLMQQYHDNEWGVPSYQDDYLFELLILEGKQAGLSWQLILNRRKELKEALDDLNWQVIKTYTDAKLDELRCDARLIRHKLKIKALRDNAIAFERIRAEFGTFSQYIWAFVNHQPIINHWTNSAQVPLKSELSDKISKDLRKRGFKFVGSTIIYSYLQAIGIINDHIENCQFKYKGEN